MIGQSIMTHEDITVKPVICDTNWQVKTYIGFEATSMGNMTLLP